jgi:Lrp/AsnC family leucine-responsive transcriptional regulator
MVDVDLKDRKILYELDLDCRQSNTQIGKKVGLKKDVVSYRINRMVDEGIIRNFWTAINTFKLGYNVFRIYINFQFVSSDKKNEIIQYFVAYKNSWAVVSVKGEIDLNVILWVNDIYEFYRFWEKTIELYGDYFANSAISILVYVYAYQKSYLLLDKHEKSGGLFYQTICGGGSIDIDKTDYQLLNILAINARTPLIELAEQLGCSSSTVNYRIKNLMHNGVIQAFRVGIDISKLGLKKFVLNVSLKEPKQKNTLLNFLQDLLSLEYIDIALGWTDMQLEVILKDVNDLTQIMDQVAFKFPNAIKKQNLMIATQYHKERWLPEF